MFADTARVTNVRIIIIINVIFINFNSFYYVIFVIFMPVREIYTRKAVADHSAQ